MFTPVPVLRPPSLVAGGAAPRSTAPRSTAALLVLLLLSAAPGLVPAAQAGPVLAGVELRQVTPPPVLFEGVRSIEVAPISGPNGAQVREELLATLADPNREVGTGTLSDKAGAMVELGAGIGAQLLASKVPGIGGKLVKGAAEAAGGAVADKVRADKIVLNDGLRIDVLQVKASGADGKLKVALKSASADRSYTEKVPLKDDKGNEVKDGNGATIMTERSCTERTTQLDLGWALEARSGAKNGALPTRKNQDTRCGEEQGKLLSAEALVAGSVPGLGGALAREIAPSWVSLRVPMRRSPLSRAPLEQVEAGQLEVARCMLQRIVELEKTVTGVDPDAWLNLGAALEAQGQLQPAIEAYQGALQRKSSLKPASEGVSRVEQRVAAVASMERAYGLRYAVPPSAACPELPAGAPALVKKGGGLVGPAGEALGREIEKGELVFVRESDGKLTELATLDGVVGRLPAKSLP